jgi:tetratricopeptide (TPR) repeat protein
MTHSKPVTIAASHTSICLLALIAAALLSNPYGTDAEVTPTSQTALAQAQSLESQGEFQEAAKQYEAALKLSPASVEARLGAGRSLAKLGRCHGSALVLQAVAGSARSQIEPILGGCYFSTHEFDEAIAHLKLARRAAPTNQEVWITLGRAYASAGHNTDAINTLKAWLSRHPRDPDALYWIGRIYNSMSQDVLDKMTAKDPNSYQVHELEGDQLRLKQDYGPALLAYQEALKGKPDGPGLHFSVGDVYYKMLKYPEAREELEKELKVNPYHAQANFELGDIAIKQGRVEDGMPYLERALKLDPGLAEAHRAMARGFLAEKRYPEAVRELLWLTKSDPSDHTAHAMLASAYRQMGKMQEAQEEAAVSQKILQDRAADLEKLKAEEQKMNDQPIVPPGSPPP